MKTKDRIYIKAWLEYKPYTNQAPTDHYYIKLCNELKDKLIKAGVNKMLYGTDISGDVVLNKLVCILVCYFEDIISKTNIWNTFSNVHQKRYEKPLPFYEVGDDYFAGEINQEDVAFLIWYVMVMAIETKSRAPKQASFTEIADIAMAIFEREYESAPENNQLLAWYAFKEDTTSYASIYIYATMWLTHTYLFHPDTATKLANDSAELSKNCKGDEYKTKLFDLQDYHMFDRPTCLLGMTGHEWLTAYLGDEHPISKANAAMSPVVYGMFVFDRIDQQKVHIEHIVTGQKFEVVYDLLPTQNGLQEAINTAAFLGIVKWNGAWRFTMTQTLYKDKKYIVQQEKESGDGQYDLDLLNYNPEPAAEFMALFKQTFQELSQGHTLLIMEYGEVADFYEQLRALLMQKGVTDGQAAALVTTPVENIQPNVPVCIYMNPEKGIEFGVGLHSLIPLAHNPYANTEDNREALKYLLTSNDVSVNLATYAYGLLKDSGVDILGGDYGYETDFDFLMRFWKAPQYAEPPLVTPEVPARAKATGE